MNGLEHVGDYTHFALKRYGECVAVEVCCASLPFGLRIYFAKGVHQSKAFVRDEKTYARKTVKELQTHAKLGQTLRYAHLAPDQKAAAVEKLDGLY